MSLNIFMANGRICKDLELRKSQSGVSNVRFTLAVNRNRKNEQGETEADFLTCIAFNKTAELLCQYCGKGSKIGVRGSLQTGSYVKDNVTHYTTDVIVQEIEFLDSKKDAAPPTQSNPNTGQLNAMQNEWQQQTAQQQYQQPAQQQQYQQPQYQQMNTGQLAPQYGQQQMPPQQAQQYQQQTGPMQVSEDDLPF